MPFAMDSLTLLSLGSGVSLGLIGGAVALGFRHGIDWDHIAAITDITSTNATAPSKRESLLMSEPGFQITDESHHAIEHGLSHEHPAAPTTASGVGAGMRTHRVEHQRATMMPAAAGMGAGGGGTYFAPERSAFASTFESQKRPLFLGTMYAIGHGSVVFVLGLLAILAREVLPDWIDPIMERVVGVTLIALAIYLFISLYQYFRGGAEFRLRSRWMLVFAGIRNGMNWVRGRVSGREHEHVHASDQYGAKTALGIGMIHGIGAETGTQALIIASATGASTKASSVLVLVAFLVGLLASNTVVTVASATGFISASRRQWIYVGAGAVAAVFSLVIGVVFLLQSGDALPDLGQYFQWIGGPK